MKTKNVFEVRTDKCVATIEVENFSEQHIEVFNRMLAEEVIKKEREAVA